MGSKFEETMVPGQYYHVYNRGNNRENIFIETRNYEYFMRLYTKYVSPFVETDAYCLMKNHFHFLIKVVEKPDPKGFQNPSGLVVSNQFGKMFNAYAKAFNKAYDRTGSLFEHPFKRVPITNQAHLTQLVIYIHQNPQKHGLVKDFKRWSYSSFSQILGGSKSMVNSKEVFSWFDGRENFIDAHRTLLSFEEAEE